MFRTDLFEDQVDAPVEIHLPAQEEQVGRHDLVVHLLPGGWEVIGPFAARILDIGDDAPAVHILFRVAGITDIDQAGRLVQVVDHEEFLPQLGNRCIPYGLARFVDDLRVLHGRRRCRTDVIQLSGAAGNDRQ
ncbi:hypothetical protein D3C71_1615030 [compost metagenome]